MNSKQIKSALSTFRAADVSIIKDDATRAQAQKLQAKQKGFTLLELLIVITLIAVLATAALTAYNGIGETASDTAAANNLLDAQSALNNYRAIEAGYPDQFDNLANASGTDADGMATLRAPETSAFFGQWVAVDAGTVGSVWKAVGDSMKAVGVEELQALTNATTFDVGYVPNLALNESYPLTNDVAPSARGTELELWANDTSGALYGGVSTTTAAVSIVPSSTTGAAGDCTAGLVSITDSFDGTTADENQRLNLINDAMDDDACVLVLAVGFGKDVPGSTSGDKVEISQVPTLGTNNVNPATHYARAVALFQVGADGSDGSIEDGVISASEIFRKARLVGIVDPEGRQRDEVIAAANDAG
ncbi:MAG: type II secretion system protein [Methylophaga sp.]|nr:type II secretion system protein [Methylophaga sp.]